MGVEEGIIKPLGGGAGNGWRSDILKAENRNAAKWVMGDDRMELWIMMLRKALRRRGDREAQRNGR